LASAGPTHAAPEILVKSLRIRSVVDSHSAAAVARRAALKAGFSASAAQCTAIATAELATNIVRHAGHGVICVYTGSRHLKVVADDTGPGFDNVDAALIDGHSGGRRLGVDDRGAGIGCGLGGVRRLMDSLEIESTKGVGARIVAIKRRPERSP
jgi:serine/threonine-protein kinase RsbT